MEFEPDDFDWAMGELLHLFARAARQGTAPHLLNKSMFHAGWSVLNAQPFEIAQQAQRTLIRIYNPWLTPTTRPNRPKRFAPTSPIASAKVIKMDFRS
jgi:hypothetical protein